MNNPLNKIFESFRGNTIVEEGTTLVAGNIGDSYEGTQPFIPFSKCIYYKDRDPRLKNAVDSYNELITGVDFSINADDEEAKAIIEEWIENTNFYLKFKSAVSTMLTCGNALIEKFDDKDENGEGRLNVDEVDITTITGKERTEFGDLIKYVQTVKGEKYDLQPPSKYIELNLELTGREAWAKSLFYPVIAPRKIDFGDNRRTTIPPIEALWSMEDDMRLIFDNYASPEVSYIFEGASKEYMKKAIEKIKKLKAGKKLVMDRKFERITNDVNPATKFDKYVDWYKDTMDLATQFSHEIFLAGFSANAASQSTESIIAKKVRSIQKYLGIKLKKELFWHVLKTHGYETAEQLNEVNLQVSFKTPNLTQLSPTDALNAYNSGAITLDEYREYLKDQTGMDLDFDDDSEIRKQNTGSTLVPNASNNATNQQIPMVDPTERLKREAYHKVIESVKKIERQGKVRDTAGKSQSS